MLLPIYEKAVLDDLAADVVRGIGQERALLGVAVAATGHDKAGGRVWSLHGLGDGIVARGAMRKAIDPGFVAFDVVGCCELAGLTRREAGARYWAWCRYCARRGRERGDG